MAPEIEVPKVPDFSVTGDGADNAWESAPWVSLAPLRQGENLRTRAKVVYSQTGLYFLADCQDKRLTCSIAEDFVDLYTEDVVEVFFQPDVAYPLYFEYEISPLGFELPIIVPNRDGHFHGWLPWHYKGARQTRRATAIRGGDRAPGAACDGWTAEFFIPFALLTGLITRAPRTGDRWRANLYRIDYDTGATSQWAWAAATGTNFHDFKNFGTFVFA